MRHALPFFVLLLLSLTNFAQKRVTVTKWEANTRNGGYFIGIAQSRMNALNDIERLSNSTAGTEREIIDFDVRMSSVIQDQSEVQNVFEQFAATNEEGELFKYLSLNDMTALKVARERGIENGKSFYINVHEYKNNKKSDSKFINEVYAFQKYLFIKERKYNETYLTYLESK